MAAVVSPDYGRCCPHPRDVHDHYRAGTDCGMGPCPRFRRYRFGPLRPGGWVWTVRFLAGMRRHPR